MFELRPYQKKAIQNANFDLLSHQKIGLILPTGAGKTEIFMHICDHFLRTGEPQGILILSHLDMLSNQTIERFKMRLPHIKIDKMQGTHYPHWENEVTVTTMQSARNKKSIDRLQETLVFPIGLIIIDEAHFLYTDSYDKALSYFPNAKIIGVTGTPFRSSKIMTSFFDKISYSVSLQQMIDEGYLVPPILKQITRRGKELNEISELIVNLYKQYEQGNQAIVYMQTIDSAKFVRNIFEDNGINCRCISSELQGSYRDTLLDKFKDGKIDVLVNCNVLTAGFDAPNLKAIFMPYATKSATQYLQRVGRGLRTFDGKTHCNVYVFGDAPSISREIYVKLHKQILYKGGEITEQETYKEDLELNDYDKSTEIYEWTKEVCDTILHMKNVGMPNLATLLNQKKFPPKFLKDIKKLIEALPNGKIRLNNGEMKASPKQLTFLLNEGFDPKTCRNMTKNEASQMIATCYRMNDSKPESKFIMPNGMFQGKHVSALPHAYRTNVLRRFPNSDVAKLIRSWQQERKKA